MGTSCCGGSNKTDHQHDHSKPGHSCCNHRHAHEHAAPRSGFGMGIILALTAAALLGVGVISAIALAQPSAPAQQKSPAPPAAPKSPDAKDLSKPAAPPTKKAYDPATDGVIRHGRAEPIAKPNGAIRIATFNIENLFDKELSNDETGSSTPAKPAAHRKAAADAIRKINADVLALEEIESKETLTKFRDEYLADMGYTHIASIDAGDPRGIEQSILSKFPIKDEKNWPNTPLAGVHPEKLGNKKNPDAGKPLILKRSPMRATVVVPPATTDKDAKPTELTLFAVHHKSGPFYSYLREAEGTRVLELIHDYEKDHPGAPVLVLGDFNARTTEKSVMVYTSGGMIHAMSGVSGGVESKEFLSHTSGRTIDHILLNAPAAAMVSLDTRFVLGTPQRPDGVDWRKTEPPAGYSSDHYPVVVDLLPRETPGSTLRRGIEAPKPVTTAAPSPSASPSPTSDRK